jgi:multicomponent Na+:H+ antiporter subunit E
MLQFLFAGLPIAVVWCLITGHVSLDSLLVGYVIGIISLAILRRLGVRFGKLHSLDQLFALLIYTGTILMTGFRSSLKIVKMVLAPKIELKTGIIALDTGDLSESQLLTALSAHGINSTPGELVIDIADGGVLYIHCIDLAATQRVVHEEQAQRIGLLRRITGERDNA